MECNNAVNFTSFRKQNCLHPYCETISIVDHNEGKNTWTEGRGIVENHGDGFCVARMRRKLWSHRQQDFGATRRQQLHEAARAPRYTGVHMQDTQILLRRPVTEKKRITSCFFHYSPCRFHQFICVIFVKTEWSQKALSLSEEY
ncbi:hypothetical protein ANCCAN_19378 [Ancylostoma caninum]|uniref:Uncharacterized protein n=1 Tax=Ancylostoma caninum TaxID=29170 RepID=A0A368FVG7_ANCCA|nr:hypothetical protein ANCCAN_19378 [Ancylostoma caninum]